MHTSPYPVFYPTVPPVVNIVHTGKFSESLCIVIMNTSTYMYIQTSWTTCVYAQSYFVALLSTKS